MNLRKKVMAFLTVVFIISGSVIVAFGEYNEISEKSITILENLNIIVDFETMNTEITQDTFSGILARLSKQKGNENSKLEVTFENVLKELILICGYQVRLDMGENYLFVAKKMGLLAGIDLKNNTLDKYSLCKMVYNALEIPMMQKVSYGEKSNYEISKDVTLLTEIFNVYKSKGIVTGNAITKLDTYNNFIALGFVEIDNQLYKDEKMIGEDYLGQICDIYYESTKGESIKKLVAIFPTNINNIVSIRGKNIISYKNNEFSYDENHQIKRISLSKKASIIYNGQSYNSLSFNEFIPKNGEITLIDNNGDNLFDVLYVYDYKTYLVRAVNSEKQSVTLKSTEDDKSISVNLFGILNKDYTIFKNNKKVATDEISVNSILTMYESKNGYKLLYISDKIAEGTVEGVNLKDGKITIDGIDYDFTQLDNIVSNISKYGKFYFDASGSIVYCKFENNYSVGFLIDVKTDSSSLDKNLKIKLLNQDGTIDIFKCDEKLVLNGSKKNVFVDNITDLWDDQKEQKDNMKPIKYIVKERVLKEIETPISDGENVDKSRLRLSYEEQSRSFKVPAQAFLDMRSELKMPLPMNVKADTRIIYVPANVNYDDGYIVTGIGSLGYDQVGMTTGYKMTDTRGVDIVIIKENPNNISYNNTLVVSKIVNAVDQNREGVKKIYGFIDGQKIDSIYVENDVDISDLEGGDFIIWNKNVKGEFAGYKKYFDAKMQKGTSPFGGLNSERSVYGEVVEYKEGIVNILGDNGINYDYNISGCNSVLEHKLETNNQKKVTLSNVKIGEKIYIRIQEEIPKMIIIYK